MAKKPTEAASKRVGWIGAYRVTGGKFAAYDAIGRTKLVSEAEASSIGIREA